MTQASTLFKVIDDLSILAKPGDKVAIIGPNGSGKTTFLRQLWCDSKEAKGLQVGYMPNNIARKFMMTKAQSNL